MITKPSFHIFNTAAKLLGFCLIVAVLPYFYGKAHTSLVSIFIAATALLLAASSILSFLSLRIENTKNGLLFEKIAGYLFILSLLAILVVTILFF